MTIRFFHKTESATWSIQESDLEAFTFPGGEPHVRDNGGPKQHAQIAVVTTPTMHDLFTLALWADLVQTRGELSWVALPYLPFARADRGAPFGARLLADFVNEYVYPDRLVALDPHSEILPGMIHELKVIDLPGLVARATKGFAYDGVIAPDKGAHDRAAAVAAKLGVPVFTAGKVRDFETGKLSGFECESLPQGKFLIVDDICDGGGTFVGLAEHLSDTQGVRRDCLDLWVSHGIFSKGVEPLLEKFAHIFTTDSWHDPAKTFTPGTVHVTTLAPYINGAFHE